MQDLKFFNTLTRKKDKFVPINFDYVTMYSCGPTVYNYAHIGNLRAYVFADVLKRTLSYAGYDVKHVMNITDVGHLVSDGDDGEDKMEKGAAREGKTAWDVAAYYTDEFKKDLKNLNIIFPDKFTPATEYIDEQIAMIKMLEEKGYIYIIEDGVYMDTSEIEDYGKLLGPDYKTALEGLNAGERIDMAGKKNKTDFALWKFSPKGEKRQMEWDSPWGVGFPGWHLECSAMASTELGETIDIHTGGIDHVPVHHTNEIAQSEICTGKQFVNYWMHNEFVNLKGMKMSKSSGDFVRMQSVLDRGINPMAYRFFLLGSHYRKQIIFTWELLEEAEANYYKLKKLIQNKVNGKNFKFLTENNYKKQIEEALADDLNTPNVIATLWIMLKDDDVSTDSKKSLLEDIDKVLGLKLLDFSDIQEEELDVPEEVVALAEQRAVARKEKDFDRADLLKNKISDRGFDIRDIRDGGYEILPKLAKPNN